METQETIQEIKINCLILKALKQAPENEFFTLRSGKKSKHFYDFKSVLLKGRALSEIGEYLGIFMENFPSIKNVAAVATGGCPMVDATVIYSDVVLQRELNGLYVSKTGEVDGNLDCLNSTLENDKKVVLFEDVMTSGNSTRQAIKTLRSKGFIVEKIYSIVIRDYEATENLEKEMGVEVFYSYNSEI